jgi:hypothetical protein
MTINKRHWAGISANRQGTLPNPRYIGFRAESTTQYSQGGMITPSTTWSLMPLLREAGEVDPLLQEQPVIPNITAQQRR